LDQAQARPQAGLGFFDDSFPSTVDFSKFYWEMGGVGGPAGATGGGGGTEAVTAGAVIAGSVAAAEPIPGAPGDGVAV
jgi:hypothetical protein